MHLPVDPLAARCRPLARLYFAGLLMLASAFGVSQPAQAAQVRWSPPAQASPTEATATRWEQLRGEDLRVANVSYRLSLDNSPFCTGSLAPQLGFVLHGLEQYAPSDRIEASRSFGLGAGIGVMAVVPNSPAAIAGLRAGDQLVSVNGVALAETTPASLPSNAAVIAARQVIVAAMARGRITLRVTGAAGDRVLNFTAEAGCPANVELVPGSSVNAWADGKGVVISSGLLERCATDDDLALVIAHELSHNLLHHSARLAAAGFVRNGLLRADGPGSAAMRQTEEEADALAVRLVAAAGFDLTHAGSFMAGLLERSESGPSDTTHPAPARRLALLTAEITAASRGNAARRNRDIGGN
jgi:hypothetical protein